MLTIIDGDTLIYKCCPGRKKYVDGKEVITLDSNGNKIQDFTEAEDAAYLELVWSNFVQALDRLNSYCFSTGYLMAIKGNGNFRLDIYDNYKKHRMAKPSPNFPIVNTIREICEYNNLAVRAHGMESDDLVRIWAEQARAADEPFIVCADDKDLSCIPGMHCRIKDVKTFQRFEITEIEALLHYHKQLLMGDTTDAIPGIRGVGEETAKNILKGADTLQMMQEAVVDAYMCVYPDDWANMLLANGKLLHIKRHYGDYFSFKEWPIVQEILNG